MREIRFVYEDERMGRARALIDALVDPVTVHLEGVRWVKASLPDPDALNVRFWNDPGEYFDAEVFFNHGIADKRYRDLEPLWPFHAIFHSGPWWQRKYIMEGADPSLLWTVGYTKMDPLFQMGPAQSGHILWAPTWSNTYDVLHQQVADALPPGVVTSGHIFDDPGKVTLRELVDADVVITDGGSIIYEAWALGKPVVFPDFAVREGDLIRPGSLEATIYDNLIGYHVQSPEDLAHTIEVARRNGITKAEMDLIDDVFPRGLRGKSGKAHADALIELARR